MADLHSFHFILELLNSIPSHSRARPSEASDIASLFSSLRPNQSQQPPQPSTSVDIFLFFSSSQKKNSITLIGLSFARRSSDLVYVQRGDSGNFNLFYFFSAVSLSLMRKIHSVLLSFFSWALTRVVRARSLHHDRRIFIEESSARARTPHTGQLRWTTLLNIGNDVPRRCDFLACVIFFSFFFWMKSSQRIYRKMIWKKISKRHMQTSSSSCDMSERERETSTVAQETFCVRNI